MQQLINKAKDLKILSSFEAEKAIQTYSNNQTSTTMQSNLHSYNRNHSHATPKILNLKRNNFSVSSHKQDFKSSRVHTPKKKHEHSYTFPHCFAYHLQRQKIHLPVYMQVHEGGHHQQLHRIKDTKTQSLWLLKNSECQEGFKRVRMLHKYEDD